MSTIFISYAREDVERAESLSWEFRMRGADVWWDRNLLSGERYIEAILRQVQQADHVLLLLSPHAVASCWVAFEVGAARSREVLAGRDILRVAQVGECDVPGFIGERQCTSLDPAGDGLRDLLVALDLPAEIDYKPPAGPADASLTVFRAGGQWMELIVSQRGLDCVLVDSGEQRARIQWSIPADRLSDLHVSVEEPHADRSWSRFDVDGNGGWRWSPTLFRTADGPAPEAAFEGKVHELLARFATM